MTDNPKQWIPLLTNIFSLSKTFHIYILSLVKIRQIPCSRDVSYLEVLQFYHNKKNFKSEILTSKDGIVHYYQKTEKIRKAVHDICKQLRKNTCSPLTFKHVISIQNIFLTVFESLIFIFIYHKNLSENLCQMKT